MEVIRVEPVTEDDNRVIITFGEFYIVIESDTHPIICSKEQMKKISDIIAMRMDQ